MSTKAHSGQLHKIARVEARLYRVDFEPHWGDAMQKFGPLEVPTVRITDYAGNEGLGFGYTIGSGGSAIVALLRNELLGHLLGMDSRNIAQIHEHLNKLIHALTPGCITSTAFSAIDVALWDLAAKRSNLPLYKMLGGARDKVPVYNTHVGWLNRSLEEVVALSRDAVQSGKFKALKLKVGKPDPFEDYERVSAVRNAVGPQIKLMVDANQSWTLSEAIKRARMLEPLDLVWLEEPLLATEVHAYSELCKRTIIPIAGGESIYSIQQFFEYARQSALGVMQPDVARIGGITNALKVCALADTAGIRVAPHVSPELSVTVAAAATNSMFVEFIPQMQPLLKESIRLENGNAIPFDRPGHGIEFDREAMRHMEVTDLGSAPAQEAA